MITLFALAFWAAAIVIFILAAVLFAEVMASMLPGRRLEAAEPLPTLVAIIPAHNESANIIPTLTDLKASLWEKARILVVADNCDDDTAQVARDHGAQVIIRDDPLHRGKGYALQYAIDELRAAPPEIISFFDADCRVPVDALPRLARLAVEYKRPVQSQYLMQPPERSEPRAAIAGFAWILMNKVRMRGLARLANVTRFTGVGLAAPWASLEDFRFGSGAITEDHALTFALAARGRAPIFDPSITIESRFPEKDDDAVTQRARWEHGSVGVITKIAAPGLLKGIMSGNAQLIAIAIDGLVPPLFMLASAIAVTVIITGVGALFGMAGPFYLAVLSGLLFAVGVLTAWLKDGRAVAPFSTLIGIVSFVLQKVKIYGGPGRQSAKTWSRTGRDGE